MDFSISVAGWYRKVPKASTKAGCLLIAAFGVTSRMAFAAFSLPVAVKVARAGSVKFSCSKYWLKGLTHRSDAQYKRRSIRKNFTSSSAAEDKACSRASSTICFFFGMPGLPA